MKNVIAVALISQVALHSWPQELRRRSNSGPDCSAIEIRLTAKLANGSPVTFLSASDLKIEFTDGEAEIVSLTPFSAIKSVAGFTNILFVVPPKADFGQPIEISGILSTLARADAFRFHAATLGPDGVLMPFSSDLTVLKSQLEYAVEMKHPLHTLKPWVLAEERAFLELRRKEGRHVIVRLFNSSNPSRSRIKYRFMHDYSLDGFASYDQAQVYQLLTPVSVDFAIPGGDASTGGDVRQSSQIQDASALQASAWSEKGYWDLHTAGKAEDSTNDLMKDVIKDNGSTYDLIVQPRFVCLSGTLRSIRIEATKPLVHLFAPQVIQMIPYQPPAGGLTN